MAPPSSWKMPIESPCCSSCVDGRVVEGDVVDVGPLAGAGLDQVEGPLDDRQVAQAEEVHLEQAQLLDAVHLVLGDDGRVLGAAAGFGLALDRQVLGQRFGRR